MKKYQITVSKHTLENQGILKLPPDMARKFEAAKKEAIKDIRTRTGLHGSRKNFPAEIVYNCLYKHHTGSTPKLECIEDDLWPFELLAAFVIRAVTENKAGDLHALARAVSALHKPERSTGTGKAFTITPKKPATFAAIKAARLTGTVKTSGEQIRKASEDLGAGKQTITARRAQSIARDEGVPAGKAGKTKKPKATSKKKSPLVSNSQIRKKADETLARLRGKKALPHPWKRNRKKTGKKVSR